MKKTFAVLLTSVMLLSIVPLDGLLRTAPAFNADNLLGISATATPSVIIDNDSCGEGLTWRIESRTLYVSGNGPMNDNLHEVWKKIKHAIIEEGVTRIGNGSFTGCLELESISIPASVTSIDNESFADWDHHGFGNSALMTIKIAEGNPVYHSAGNCLIRTAAKELVLGCGSSVIPDDGSVETIRWEAFNYCKTLKEIDIPDSVAAIGSFAGCEALERITIGSALKDINAKTFRGCTSLKNIEISKENPYFYSKDNCIIRYGKNKTGDTFVLGVNNAMLPDDGSITSIGEEAFCDNTELIKIVVPEGVKSISASAFSGCTALKKVTLPESLVQINRNAFSDCTSLKEITIPDNVTSLWEAFNGCTSLSRVKIGAKTATIRTPLFKNCNSLETIEVSQDNPSFRSVGNCLIDIEKKEVIAGCKNSVIPAGGSVTSIGDAAFNCCVGLKKIIIPEGVTHIGVNAFADCEDLETVEMADSVAVMDRGAFYSCDSLTEVKLSEQLTAIENSVFSDCRSLEHIVLPKALEKINGSAFRYCESLQEIRIPETVTAIETGAFTQCSSLEEITLPKNIFSIEKDTFVSCDNLKTVVIPEGVKTIGETAFSHCTSLADVTVPDSVTVIGKSAFADCTSLSTLTIPDSVTDIGPNAFQRSHCVLLCNKGSAAFEYCQKNSGVAYVLLDGTKEENTISGPIEEKCFIPGTETDKNARWSLDKTSFSLTVECRGTMNLEWNLVPWKDYEDYIHHIILSDGLTAVNNAAFSRCLRLEDISIPASVEQFPSNPFYSCYQFSGYTVADGNAHYSGENGILFNKDKTELLCYPNAKEEKTYVVPAGVKTIGSKAFSNAHYLSEVVLPEGLQKIGNAFSDCAALTKINIPDSVTKIDSEAFRNAGTDADHFILDVSNNNEYYCAVKNVLFSKDRSVLIWYPAALPSDSYTIPAGVNLIEKNAFDHCYALKTIVIPDTVTSIGEKAFDGCYYLESITIPKSVTSVGAEAISKYGNLKTVYYTGTREQWERVFGNIELPEEATVLLIDAPETDISEIYNVKLSSARIVFNGTVQQPEVTVLNARGIKLTVGTDYRLDCPASKDPGTYTLTVTGIGQYTGTVEKQYAIVKAEDHTHTFGEWTVTKAATPDAEGEESRSCTVCGVKETRQIPKIEKPESTFVRGDVDGNGEIESADARLALRASVQLERYEANSAQFLAADVNGNGEIESSDARTILRVSVKLETFA